MSRTGRRSISTSVLAFTSTTVLSVSCSSEPAKVRVSESGVSLLSERAAASLEALSVTASFPSTSSLTPKVKIFVSNARPKALAQATVTIHRVVTDAPDKLATAKDPVVAKGKGLVEVDENGDNSDINKYIQFYVEAHSSYGQTVTATLTLPSIRKCPNDKFVLVKGSSLAGLGNASSKSVGDFCVAKYEMKAEDAAGALYNNGVGEFSYIADPKPASRADGKPWVNINRDQAQAECASLGAGYSLPTNSQWQVLARDIESVADNWVGAVAGNGVALKGHSDGFPPSALSAVTDDALGFFETGNSATAENGPDQNRVFTTSNGEKIWDFSGNAREWIIDDLESLGASPNLSPTKVELEALSDINRLIFGPVTKASDALASLGRVLAGDKGAVLRGGGFRSREDAGIFSAYAVTSSAFAFADFGFRCVYVPSVK